MDDNRTNIDWEEVEEEQRHEDAFGGYEIKKSFDNDDVDEDDNEDVPF